MFNFRYLGFYFLWLTLSCAEKFAPKILTTPQQNSYTITVQTESPHGNCKLHAEYIYPAIR